MALDQYYKTYVTVYGDEQKVWCRTFFILSKDKNENLIIDSTYKGEIGTIVKIEFSNPFCIFEKIKVDQIL
jgi:hypothetical protein